ncbi:hypothetical protein Taro_053676 [Colocasia esculenta]|uniref:Uncharacterized protein n=1 Tax=Colocasia esculenta TaxID=4460 RepID=A0A843XNA7_COLES|nr:hypothetical protein [Colocasia esculenta]
MPAPLLANPSILDTTTPPLHHNLALRSGRMFHRMYPNASMPMPGQQTNNQQQQDTEEIDPAPETQYDILKHLDQTPAKISILELIKRSQTHQDALRTFLQRVMVSEDMNPDNLPSVLSIVNRGPTITFSDGDLAAPEARKMPLCVTLTINKVAVDAALRKYDIPAYLKEWVMKDLDQKWRSWKYELRNKYFNPTLKQNEQQIPSDPRVNVEQWKRDVQHGLLIVGRYSDINKKIKSHHKYFHCAGTKSFADINEEEVELDDT